MNLKLKEKNMNLETLLGISRGIYLDVLMEVLSKKPINGYNKNPKMMMHHINNLTLAFDRIKQENIRLENIGSNG
jgi:hypothetical protein